MSMYFCTPQLQRQHKFDKNDMKIKCEGTYLSQADKMKILGVTFDKYLSWAEHIDKVAKDGFSTLQTLKLLRRLLSFKVRVQLVTTLVLSKLDYGNVLLCNLPLHLQRKLQKVQNAAAGFALRKHAGIEDVLKLSWLPTLERTEYAVAVLAFKAMHHHSPNNINVKIKENKRNLRSDRDVGIMITYDEPAKTFQYDAKRVFNNLPQVIRESTNIQSFKHKKKFQIKNFFWIKLRLEF